MLAELLPLIMLGFSLGMMHALDADHVMAVSALSSEHAGFRRTISHCMHWALGHGSVLVLSGFLLFGLGIAIPERLTHLAELAVGVLLIALGLMCFRQIYREKLEIKVHRHGDIEHAHWHDSSREHTAHKPVFVGVMHGLAGSAPALALMPAVATGEIAIAIAYLLLFSLGVMLAMLLFGFGFAKVQGFLIDRYHAAYQLSRHALAFASIGLGSFWLVHSV